MSNKNLMIDLKRRTDKDGMVFYIGKIKGPFTIDCSKGIAFLIFTADLNQEQLQIAAMDESKEDKHEDF